MPRSTLTFRLSNKQALDTRSPCERKGGKMVVTAVAAAARGEGDDKKVPSPPSSSSSSSSQDEAPSPPFLRRLAGAVTLEPVIFFYMVVDSSFPSNIQCYLCMYVILAINLNLNFKYKIFQIFLSYVFKDNYFSPTRGEPRPAHPGLAGDRPSARLRLLRRSNVRQDGQEAAHTHAANWYGWKST